MALVIFADLSLFRQIFPIFTTQADEINSMESFNHLFTNHDPFRFHFTIPSVIDPNFQLDFPSTTSLMDYAKTEMTQDLTEATVCFWMKTDDDENQGTPFSYATPEGSNIFTLSDYDG